MATISIATADGVNLEGEIASPSGLDGEIERAVVVCHPHPLYGGSMDANVVDALFRALPPLGVAVLRFNFRGAGRSGGTHGGGQAERLDVAAAVARAAELWPRAQLLLAGYSFGADVALTVDDPAVAGWLAVAPPLRVLDIADMAALTDERPKIFVGAAHDQFNPYDALVEALADVPNATVRRAEGADHFFAVGLDEVVRAAREALGLSPRPDGR